ncbi:MAG: 8-oxoguanine deaminase [Verrucomicrobiae bacterium]|nr:8-oxoguanine deaminase [Verrucomicrobiae bacterium]
MNWLISHGTVLVAQPSPDPRAPVTWQTLPDHHVLVRDNQIEAVTPTLSSNWQPDETLDATGCFVLPGLINTHHHLFQSISRCLPAVQNASLFAWLTGLYPGWRAVDFQALKIAAQVSLAELMLSGCTTTNDMMYLFPRGSDVRLEAVLEAADELGIRIHAGRGSMAIGQRHGSLAPDELTEEEPVILRDAERVLRRFHNRARLAMQRVDLMPCAPFSISRELFRDTLQLARAYGALCHTHVAETLDEERYCRNRFGLRPLDYVMSAGWHGPDVSLAHCVHVNTDEIHQLATTHTAVAHCPSSNMILGSGIPPVVEMLRAGVTVGLGVDGSASNHGGHLLAEARQALLLQRVRYGAGSFTAQDAITLATVGGARLLNRADELGNLAPGYAADVAIFDLGTIEFAGAAVHDPLAALVMCHAPRVRDVFVNGRLVVRNGQLTRVDERALAARLNETVRRLYR